MAGGPSSRGPRWRAALAALGIATQGCTHDFDDLLVGATGAGAGAATSSSTGSGEGGGPSASSAASGGGQSPCAGGGGGSGPGGSASSASSGGSGPGVLDYPAAVADCVDTSAPNPDTCETEAGAGQMLIDTAYSSGNGMPRHVFIRFDIDNALAGKTITSATLRLTVAENGSSSSGELWEVAEFDRNVLFSAVPLSMGAAPMAGAQDAAAAKTLEFSVTTTLIAANGSVYLGLIPVSSDAPFYWNKNGTSPPLLRVEYQ